MHTYSTLDICLADWVHYRLSLTSAGNKMPGLSREPSQPQCEHTRYVLLQLQTFLQPSAVQAAATGCDLLHESTGGGHDARATWQTSWKAKDWLWMPSRPAIYLIVCAS